jgi:hypothetical protein
MELTVVLTNYLRPANMAVILDALASQTLPHQVFVWDNSPEQSFAGQADWVVRSSRNAMCSARWWLAAHAETPWVLVMDDDLAPADQRVLADLLEKLAEHAPTPVGAAGVILDPSIAYSECPRVGLECSRISIDTQVDILKGRFFSAPTQRLESLGFLPLDAEDDIAASAHLQGGVVVPWLQDRLRELPTAGEARWRRPKHKQTREDARRQWFEK